MQPVTDNIIFRVPDKRKSGSHQASTRGVTITFSKEFTDEFEIPEVVVPLVEHRAISDYAISQEELDKQVLHKLKDPWRPSSIL